MKFLFALTNRRKTEFQPKDRRRFRPSLELLEDRLAPATFVVNTAADENDGIGVGGVSLREAITAANATTAADTINFSIGAGGFQTISLSSALPALTRPVVIAGNTQPGFNGSPLIQISGTSAGASANGLVMKAAGSTVRSVGVVNFKGNGILALGSNNVVEGCYIGLNSAGALPNQFHGVLITGAATGVRIGGTTAAARNVISSNGLSGVAILGALTKSNKVQGNFIGTDVTGTLDRGNTGDGVLISDGSDFNLIGGTVAGSRNVISGNDSDGVEISGAGTTGNLVQGNFIGTDVSGNADLGNSALGVLISAGAVNNTVGGTVAGARNVISGNSSGVSINDIGTTGNLVRGNFIGTDVTGAASLKNSSDGVRIRNGAANNTVGGTLAGTRNVISGNENEGIEIRDAATTGNKVQGNFIGTDVTGTADLGNGGHGILIPNGAANNTVGGTVAGARNVISGNNLVGVFISGAGNKVQGNFIGTNAAGTADLGNSAAGVQIAGANNTVGGTVAGARNVISGNDGDGVAITGSGSTGNKVQGNFIGTNATGTADLGNTIDGILISNGAANNTVGGAVAGARNVISGNDIHGVEINGADSTGNLVQGNFIGTNAAGTADLGNSSDGVQISGGAENNTVGGTVAVARNVISGNGNNGIEIRDGSNGTKIQGNFIGTNAAGTASLGNDNIGVTIVSSANNTVGGTAAGSRNIISGNGSGVGMAGGSTTGNVVQGNFIGTNTLGTADLGNSGIGVFIFAGADNNTVGGTAAAARNVISGNDVGVSITGTGVTGNVVQGNFIGLAAIGASALGNTRHGVFVADAAANNSIGGTATGAGNAIAHNGGDGVLIGSDAGLGVTTAAGSGNSVQGNRIFSNAGQDIDLGANDGPTANDTNDPDTGPNDLLNTPVLTNAFLSANSLLIMGSINTLTSSELRIEFFASPPSGLGQTFLGFLNVDMGGDNTLVFTKVLTVPASVLKGHKLTATITDDLGNTSEFSLELTIE